MAEGECIAYYEAASFNEQKVCVEGSVGLVDTSGTTRKNLFIFLAPRQHAISFQAKFAFYGWGWLDEMGDLVNTNLAEHFIGNCVRISGIIERFEGTYRIVIESPEQMEMIDCSECDVPDACKFTD